MSDKNWGNYLYKQPPDTDEIPRHRAKKDKKRWCGGRIGKSHIWGEPEIAWPGFRNTYWPWVYATEKCQRCGKHGKMSELPNPNYDELRNRVIRSRNL
jgi:hypothetical protein